MSYPTPEPWRCGLRPEPRLSLADWCEAHRVLPATAARPGRWRNDATPYLREILDALSPSSGVERVVVSKAAQTGGSELALNLIAYVIAHSGGPALVVQPSLDMSDRFVRGRVDPMIEAMPILEERVGGVGSRKTSNTLRRKSFPGGEIVFAGSNSASSLRSMPARFIVLDEVDAYQTDLGGEGDPILLAEARSITFGSRKKILLISTPTVEGASRIDAGYRETDQRVYELPCPDCGGHFVPAFVMLDVDGLICPLCGVVISEGRKPWMIAHGRWKVTAEAADPRSRGYHIGGLISPFVSWRDLVLEHERVKDDPPRLKAFTNTRLGELWHESAARNIDAAALAARAEPFGPEIDSRIGVAVAGVDFQDRWFVVHIVGFGEDEEAWSLGYHVYHDDPSERQFWNALDDILSRPIRLPGGRTVPIRAACLDSGGVLTQKVLEFCSTRHRRGIYAIKGSTLPAAQAWPRKPSLSKTKWPLYVIGVGSLKEMLFARLPKEAGPGAWHFPEGRDAAFFAEMTSERPRTIYRQGRAVREWFKPDAARNEAWDSSIYALAALQALKLRGAGFDFNIDLSSKVQPAPHPRIARSKWLQGA